MILPLPGRPALRAVLALLLGLAVACGTPSADRKREAKARMEMGVTYLNQRNLPAAMRELTRASELDPDNSDVDMVFGLAYQARGDFDKAEEYFRDAIRKNPDSAEARNNLGQLLSRMGRGEEAIRQFRAAAENVLYPTPEYAYHNLGEEYARRPDPPKAEAMYRRAIALNPRFPDPYLGLARVLESGGRAEEAAGVLERCLEYLPAYAPVWMELGNVHARAGRDGKARDAYRSALENSGDPEFRRKASEAMNRLRGGR